MKLPSIPSIPVSELGLDPAMKGKLTRAINQRAMIWAQEKEASATKERANLEIGAIYSLLEGMVRKVSSPNVGSIRRDVRDIPKFSKEKLAQILVTKHKMDADAVAKLIEQCTTYTRSVSFVFEPEKVRVGNGGDDGEEG